MKVCFQPWYNSLLLTELKAPINLLTNKKAPSQEHDINTVMPSHRLLFPSWEMRKNAAIVPVVMAQGSTKCHHQQHQLRKFRIPNTHPTTCRCLPDESSVWRRGHSTFKWDWWSCIVLTGQKCSPFLVSDVTIIVVRAFLRQHFGVL